MPATATAAAAATVSHPVTTPLVARKRSTAGVLSPGAECPLLIAPLIAVKPMLVR
jgi:hypothetical protein